MNVWLKEDKKEKKNERTGTPATLSNTTRTEGMLWNYISQINATIASKDLYSTVNSDLINSYAWDTAIVYIQNF